MKRHLSLLASVLLVIAMVFAFASCEYVEQFLPGNNQTHEHSFTEGKCECGETDPNYKAPCEHTYADGVCTACGEADPNYKPECESHTYGAPTVTKEATCTEKGERSLTCTECGYVHTTEIAPTGHKGGTATCQAKAVCTACGNEYGELGVHKEVSIPAVEFTCDTDGSTAGSKCETCGEVFTAPETIPAHHVGGTATCKAKAVCTACGEEYGELGGHTETEIPAVAPTCTKDGSYGGVTCSVCDETLTEATVAPATGHNFVDLQCTNCRLYHEDHTGPKTHIFKYDDIPATKDKDTVNPGLYTHGYFEVVGKVIQRHGKAGLKNLEINKFGLGGIRFTVEGTATVEIKICSTGGSNTSWFALVDAEGNFIANNEEAYSVYGNAGVVFTYELTAGTYTLISPDYRIPVKNEDGSHATDEDGKELYEKFPEDHANAGKEIEEDPVTGDKIYYSRGIHFLSISVTETPAEENESVNGIIDVVTTDTYCYADEYTFVAPVSGTYTFTIPTGLGFWSNNSNRGPEVDAIGIHYNPDEDHTVTIALVAGEELGFTIGAATKDNWTIAWTGVAGEAGDDGDDEPVEGGFTGMYDATDGWGNVMSVVITDTTITFQPIRSPEIVWTYELNGDVITLYSDGTELTNPMFGSVTVKNGVPTALSYNMTDYTLTRAGASGGDDEDDTNTVDLVSGYNQINAANVNFTFTAPISGKLTLTAGGASMGMVSITYTVNGDDAQVLELSSTVTLDLFVGDVVVIYVEAEGYSTITAAWESGSTGDDNDEPGEGGGDEPTEPSVGTLYDEEENTVTVTEADITAGKMLFNFMPWNDGNYSFSSYDLCFTSISLDGVALELNDDGYFTLASYVTYVVEFEVPSSLAAGDYTITPTFIYPLGHQKNPHWFFGEMGEANTMTYPAGYTIVWYSFYASANGTVTLSCADANVTLLLALDPSCALEGTETVSLNVMANGEYYFGFVDLNAEEPKEITYTLSFTEGEYVGDGAINTPYVVTAGSNTITLEEWGYAYFVFITEDSGNLTITTENESCVWYIIGQEDYASDNEDKTIYLGYYGSALIYIETMDATTVEFTATFVSEY